MKNKALTFAFKESSTGNQLIIQSKKAIYRDKVAKSIRAINTIFWDTWVTSANTDKGIDKDFSWRKAVYKEYKPAIKKLALNAIHGKDTEYRRFIQRCKAHDFKGAFELV